MFELTCRECGKKFLSKRKHGKYCCEACRIEGKRKQGRETSREYYERKRQAEGEKLMRKWDLAEIGRKAREEGLTYGQYVAKHGL